VANNNSLLAEDGGDDPFSFAAKRILSFPALVNKDSTVSRRRLSCAQYLSTEMLSGNELESELDVAPLSAGVGSTVPSDDNCLDLDYSWME
jgi:hypothetical protein